MGKGINSGQILVVAVATATACTPSERSDSIFRPSGAIFTTTEDGSVVNENHFDDCRDVYLNGGPKKRGTPCLPDGDYYFQVTTPSGGPPSLLLSSDLIDPERRFTVDDCEISAYAGSHDTGIDVDDGGLTVQLFPFLETTNPGGVYKVTITPVGDFTPGEGHFGFLHSDSKSDNFKCEFPAPPPPDAGPPPPDAGPPPPDARPHDACPPPVPDAGPPDAAPEPDGGVCFCPVPLVCPSMTRID